MCPTATEIDQPSMSLASVTVPELDSLLDNVRYVPKRVAHHAQHSGYDALFTALNMRQTRSGSLRCGSAAATVVSPRFTTRRRFWTSE
jgi:hypothetical protein